MDVVAISLFVVLELTILLGIAVFVVNRKRKQLQAQLRTALAEEQTEPAEFESIASGYLAYLEKQLLESREKIESGEDETPDENLLAALGHRVSLLEAEKKVTERCNDYPESRWQHVAELFTPPPPPEPEPEEETANEAPGEVDDEALTRANERIKSLEKFRDHFFAMKNQLKDLEEARQKLVDKLEALMPEAERSDELKALLEEMNAQRDRLQGELDQLEAQSDQLAKADRTEVAAETAEPQRINELSEVMGQQGDMIASIKQVVEQVKDDPNAELIGNLETQISELERRYQEASDCLQIMTEENERLQDKVDRKDQRIERVEEEKNESVADLAEQVDNQKKKMSELHGLVGELQLEADKAEELQAKLEQFDLASRDMNMCIQVLEEENQFLQEQVRALLQMDEGDSIYESTDNNESDELRQQIESMQAQIAEKDEKIKALEAQYASMEQEYLTLYEEANS